MEKLGLLNLKLDAKNIVVLTYGFYRDGRWMDKGKTGKEK